MAESTPARTTAADAPASARRRGSRGDSYEHLEPLFARLAAFESDDPRRERVRSEIVRLGLPLAEHIARRFANRGEPFDDLLQTARVGLVQAVDRFDHTRGAAFLSFAVPTIMGEVRRHFRDHTWSVRVSRHTKEIHGRIGSATEVLAHRLGRMPTARELAVELEVDVTEISRAMIAANCYTTDSLDMTVRDQDGDSSTPAVERLSTEEPCYRLLEDAMAVRPLIARLPQRERQILIWRYFGAMTQSQIADRLGISQMQVSRILSRTLTRLRDEALADPEPAEDDSRSALSVR
ncbi:MULTISPECIES: RNA polymerase sigma factor SigF [unclassified Nocardia]|uniref:RNA polymerase sigma factor SigF n=1 Tax=unclassified Nocardia TaxID=2637762 RepID=UPI0024A7F763|nr:MULTISPECIES: RNA polymerase sigma factor SigF [unclassified Nocardia]